VVIADLHCHLDLYPEPARVAAECVSRGVYVLSVTTVPSAFRGTAGLAPGGSRIRTALGLHPELVPSRQHELATFESLLRETRYVGEVGLDGSHAHRLHLSRQETVLRKILCLCHRAGGRVLSVHSRGATGAILDVVQTEPSPGRIILHWYLGSARQVARAAELGCWFSVGPTMLASPRGRAAASGMPRNRVLLESDGPFGTIDGKPVYPWDTQRVLPVLASLWGESVDTVQERVTRAFREIVKGDMPTGRGP
jgi:TatD DNase family protein